MNSVIRVLYPAKALQWTDTTWKKLNILYTSNLIILATLNSNLRGDKHAFINYLFTYFAVKPKMCFFFFFQGGGSLVPKARQRQALETILSIDKQYDYYNYFSIICWLHISVTKWVMDTFQFNCCEAMILTVPVPWATALNLFFSLLDPSDS